jgi:CheY-like chemotaxis protein
LREWGYSVDEARDGAAAIAFARRSRPDLMLIDLTMPVMDGWALIERLRGEKIVDGVPVVVFTADRHGADEAKRLAADAVVNKPFDLEELQGVVEGLLERKPPP